MPGRRALFATAGALTAAAMLRPAHAAEGPPATPAGAMELFRTAAAPTTPTGMAISRVGRVFIFMPRFDDKLQYSVGEVAADGSVSAWPTLSANHADPKRPADTLFFVPNGVFDGDDRLWVLDAGMMATGGPLPGAPKLLCYDIATGTVLRRIPLDAGVEKTSSLNDLRVDTAPGHRQAAYISDQGQDGQGAVVVVDLETGRVQRRLARHASTATAPGTLKLVEGVVVEKRNADGTTKPVTGGANGIALSPDGRSLYVAPLIGRHLYAVDTATLLDPAADDAAVAATVRDLGEKGMTGGLIADGQDRVYLSWQEFNAVGRRNPDGRIETVASDPRLIWPDTFQIHDGWLYVSATQVNRRPEFNGGTDRQVPPYAILRVRL